jgi:hypothetical protein
MKFKRIQNHEFDHIFMKQVDHEYKIATANNHQYKLFAFG